MASSSMERAVAAKGSPPRPIWARNRSWPSSFVLPEDLVDDLLRAAGEQGTAWSGPRVERVAGQELTAGGGHVVADVAGVVRVEGVAGALGGGFDVEVAGHPDPEVVGSWPASAPVRR